MKTFNFNEKLPHIISQDEIQTHFSSKGCLLEIFINNEKMTSGITTIPPQSRLGRIAAHSGDEIYFILSGECIVECSRHQKEFLLKKGDFFYIPGGQIHAPRNDSKEEAVEILWFCTPNWP